MSSKRKATPTTPEKEKPMKTSKSSSSTNVKAEVSTSKEITGSPTTPFSKRIHFDVTTPKSADTLPVIGRSVNAKYRRHSDPTKIFETDALKADNNRSSIVKAKHKKEKSFPVAWRSELNKPRSGSAQARLENLRAALQKEIDDQKEQKSKASTSESKHSSDQNSFPVQTVTSIESNCQVTTSKKIRDIKNGKKKHRSKTDTCITKVFPYEKTRQKLKSTSSNIIADLPKTPHSSGLHVEVITPKSSVQSKSITPNWRNELYNHSPAQARLDRLKAELQTEINDQKKPESEASTSVTKCPLNEEKFSSKNISSIGTSNDVAISQETDVICHMDIDDTDISSTVASPVISEKHQNLSLDSMECDSVPELKQILPESRPSELKKEKNGRESELKSKYDEGLSNYPRYFYCIVDTCVFINHYKDIDNFLTKKFADRQPILIVPYKVLDELDIVKYKKPHLETQIMPVIKFLHRMLRAKDPRIKGQHPWDDTVEFMPINSPDDSIINCALQVQSVADSEAKVLVVSNDCNMLTKALVAHLDSCTMAELQKDYKF